VKSGGGTEVYDYAGAAIFPECRHTVGDAVGADLSRILVVHRHTRAYTWLKEERLGAEVAFANLAQRGIHRRDDGGDDDSMNGGDLDIGGGKQVAEEDTVLVNGLRPIGGYAPVGDQAIVVIGSGVLVLGEDAEHGVGVADVEDE